MPIRAVFDRTPPLAVAPSPSRRWRSRPRRPRAILLELYDAAHAYDATYLAARALAESAPYRVEPGAGAAAAERRALPANVARGRGQPDGRRELRQQHRLRRRAINGRAAALQPRQRRDHRAGGALARVVAGRPRHRRAGPDRCASARPTSTCSAPRTRCRPRAPARRRSPSSSPRPSATSRSAPPPSPTPARRRRASTWRRRRRSPPRTTCVTKRIALDQLVGRSNVAPKPAGGAGGAAGAGATRRRGAGSSAPPRSIRRCAGAPGRLRGRAARDREGARRRRLPTVDAVASVGRRPRHASSRAPPATAPAQHRPAAQHAALHRRRDPEPHQGNAGRSRSESRNDLEAARRGVDAGDAAGVSTRCSRARRR